MSPSYIASAADGLVGSLILTWAIIMSALVIGLVIWSLALYHLIRHADIANRWLWLVVVVLFPILGAIVYFFGVLIPYNRDHPYIPVSKPANTK